MNKSMQLACLGLACLLSFVSSFAHEPKNLSISKATVVKYHDSGEYQRDQARVIDKAMEYLKTRLKKEKALHSAKKLALVLDIDETALSNYPDMQKMSFGGTLKQMMDAAAAGKDPAITPVLKLYQYAKENNVAVFFITGRPEQYRVITEKNLISEGYQNWNGLSFKQENYKETSTAPYKIRARAQIEKQGYDIILNIGDQQSDLSGGYADKTFKLPNPYYLIP